VSEAAEVLEAISSWQGRRRKMALATIVRVRGSTYRRPGARLLVADDGSMVGNLSGGCLEGEVQGLARQVMDSGAPQLALYDLTADDEVVWGWGLGCNGAIEVFIEPASKAAEIADALRLAMLEERPIAVATVLESSIPEVGVGARCLIEDGEMSASLGRRDVDEAAGAAVRAAVADGESQTRDVAPTDGAVRLFIEVIEPPLRLLVCGAGHDAVPLVRAASSLGWRVVVADDREALLSRERFASAREFVLTEPSKVAADAAVDERTYAVVMTHNYLRDKDYLKALLDSDAAYIGMLGPRARLERLVEELTSEGVAVGDARGGRKLHGPAGLDLGAEGPEEIAAAIVAEVLAVSRDRKGGFLKERATPIHTRPQKTTTT
jgi:xanthine dehydrogenase accessory factor